MSNETNTADKRISGEKTVKKKAARNVVVSPVNVKSSGNPRPSREVTAPMGLVWNEDKMEPKKPVKKTQAPQPQRPVFTGTGWPDRPPVPKVNRPSYKPKVQQAEAQPALQGRQDIKPVKKPEPPVRKEPDHIPEPAKKEPVKKPDPARKPEPAKIPDTGLNKKEPVKNKPAVNPLKKDGVLFSPVTPKEARAPISPMQKRPGSNGQVSVQSTVQGPVQQIPLAGGDFGSGAKFVRTVVTTTTTTYEPVSEDVIRQITSQTTQTGIPDQILASQQTGQIPGQQVVVRQQTPERTPGQQAPVRRQPQRRPAQPGQGQPVRRQAPPGQAPISQNPAVRQPQAGPQPGQQQPIVQQPTVRQPVIPQQEPVIQQAQQQPQMQAPMPQAQPVQGQRQSIIGTMEMMGPGQGQPVTAMDKQFAEIEKALGLTNDAGGMNPGVNPQVPNMPVIGDKPISVGKPVQEMDKETKKSMEYMMLFVEGVIFLIVLAICISIYQKIKKGAVDVPKQTDSSYEEQADQGTGDTGSDDAAPDEGTESFETQEAGTDDIISDSSDIIGGDSSSTPSGSVDVDNDNFNLKCTNVTVKLDTDGNPVALIYFSFTNKTSNQLALADVFPISVTQNGEPCDTSAALEEYPEEFYNKDMQISDGSELSCAYAVTLKDAVSPITLTVHDNYETFADVGSTEIAIQ